MVDLFDLCIGQPRQTPFVRLRSFPPDPFPPSPRTSIFIQNHDDPLSRESHIILFQRRPGPPSARPRTREAHAGRQPGAEDPKPTGPRGAHFAGHSRGRRGSAIADCVITLPRMSWFHLSPQPFFCRLSFLPGTFLSFRGWVLVRLLLSDTLTSPP